MDEGKSGSGLLVGTGLGGLGGGQIECLGLGDQIVEIGGLQRAGLLEDDLALLGDHQRGHRLDAGGLGQIGYQYGYIGYNATVMNTVLVLLVVLVYLIQLSGDRIVRAVTHK